MTITGSPLRSERDRWPRGVGAVLMALTLSAATACASTHTDGLARPTPVPGSHTTAARTATASTVPRPSHTILVILENESYAEIIGSHDAPYLNGLAANGASFVRSFATTHPSEPNYLALFSGSTHGITTDSCPHTFTGRNLGSELRAAGETFAGYSESLPRTGYSGCSLGPYARKHNPWVDFSDLPRSTDRPFAAFPAKFSGLPTLSVVVPNLNHDMHDGTVGQGDRWLKQHLGTYARAAEHDNGLFIVTWDEDDGTAPNRIPTIIVGTDVKPGRYSERINDYRLLRTLESAYELPLLGHSAARRPITNIWKKAATG